MAILHFSHTGICVSDLERPTAFYRDALGFEQHHCLHVEGEPASTLLRIKKVELDVVYLERDGTLIERVQSLADPKRLPLQPDDLEC